MFWKGTWCAKNQNNSAHQSKKQKGWDVFEWVHANAKCNVFHPKTLWFLKLLIN